MSSMMQPGPRLVDPEPVGMSDEEELRRAGYGDTSGVGEVSDLTHDLRELGIDTAITGY